MGKKPHIRSHRETVILVTGNARGPQKRPPIRAELRWNTGDQLGNLAVGQVLRVQPRRGSTGVCDRANNDDTFGPRLNGLGRDNVSASFVATFVKPKQAMIGQTANNEVTQ